MKAVGWFERAIKFQLVQHPLPKPSARSSFVNTLSTNPLHTLHTSSTYPSSTPVPLIVPVGGREVLFDEDAVLWPLGSGGGFEVPHITLDKALRVATTGRAEEL